MFTLLFIIAIDGPSGSGKSTTAKAVAGRLGFLSLDTGAMYRALALLSLEESVSPDDIDSVVRLAEHVDLQIKPPANNGSSPHLTEALARGVAVGEKIRQPNVTECVSRISSIKEAREVVVRKQRELAKRIDSLIKSSDVNERNNSPKGIVAEGRDIGTVVFPDADLKIFMNASLTTRAQRRSKELVESGVATEPNEQLKELERRDIIDTTRAESPLTPAADAVLLDTTDLSFEEQVARICELAESRMKSNDLLKDNAFDDTVRKKDS
ncbi:MAG: (d)CMP kinase [candidate division Zixibacteria bacterium]|nr:(d)CMP kinase [candidate division Zixibacteria bacterium]